MAVPEETVGTATVAAYLDLSVVRVRDLTAEGILQTARYKGRPLKGRYVLREATNAYIRFLRKTKVPGDDYSVARSRRMAAAAQIEELKLAELQGKMHYESDCEFVNVQMVTRFRSRSLAIASRVANTLVGETDPKKIRAVVNGEVRLALSELSGFKRKMIAHQSEKYLKKIGANGQDEEETDADE